ncbi:hypothetical protein JCM3765_001662 [Sporobolomyces pararoseus]
MDTIDRFTLADILEELSSSMRNFSQQLSSDVGIRRSIRPTQLFERLEINDDFSIFDIYTPDVWTLLVFFLITVSVKFAFQFGLNKAAVRRTRERLEAKFGHEVEEHVARAALKKPLAYVIGWILTIALETTCFVLQCCAWRAWRIDEQPLRAQDLHYIFTLIKILLIGYAADLMIAEKGYDIYLHHCLSFLLLFVGQCTLYSTEDTIFPRLANWMILQATLAFPLYFGLGFVQFERYLHVQDYKPGLQKRALKYGYYCLRVMTIIYIPQKVVPAAFCLYWLASMWNDVKHSAWGISWLTIATLTVPLLLLLQIFVLSDSVCAMTNYIGYKVNGGPLPSKRGPIARFISRLFFRLRSTSSALDSKRAFSSNEKKLEGNGADEQATNASAKSSTPLIFVNLMKDAGRKGSVASSMSS